MFRQRIIYPRLQPSAHVVNIRDGGGCCGRVLVMAMALTAIAAISPTARNVRSRVMASEPVGQDATAAAPWSGLPRPRDQGFGGGGGGGGIGCPSFGGTS
jgi:hypothetical protein